MKCRYRAQFKKDLKGLSKEAQSRVIGFLEGAREAHKLSDLGLKKLSGYKSKYRKRLGDYRVGITWQDQVLTFDRVLPRQVIYKKFP